jgi:dihydrofolate synthase / folylpolyglutamate synthase
MGMLSTKDHGDIFKALLRPGDRLTVVPVAEHSTADSKELAELAIMVCPALDTCETAPSLIEGLQRLGQEQRSSEYLSILCGSLYLVGEFLSLPKEVPEFIR